MPDISFWGVSAWPLLAVLIAVVVMLDEIRSSRR